MAGQFRLPERERRDLEAGNSPYGRHSPAGLERRQPMFCRRAGVEGPVMMPGVASAMLTMKEVLPSCWMLHRPGVLSVAGFWFARPIGVSPAPVAAASFRQDAPSGLKG